MPWTAKDVDRFKKGLSDLGKRKWVAVANSALQKCRKDGEKDCEGRAARMANASVGESDFALHSVTVRDFSPAEIEIKEDTGGQGQAPRKELVVTLLKEGPGNQFHNNYYTRSALESALAQVKARPKQYFNHAKDVDNPDRDLRDWASSIQEAWIDDKSGKPTLRARVKVHDGWLWERAKVAPTEMAVSIEGRGSGQPEVIEGKEYNAIREITHLNGVNWVDYPGNAGMGVEVLESDKNKNSMEAAMKLTKEMIESLKGMTREELRETVDSNPELKEFFFLPAEDTDTKEQIKALSEQVKQIKSDADSQSKNLSEKVTVLENEKVRLSNQLESHQLKAQEEAKAKLVERLLKASKLQDKHKTDTFQKTLLTVKEYKNGEKVVTEEEQMKTLIEDREKICIAEVASPGDGGGQSSGSDISEDEQHRQFAIGIFGIDPKIKEEDKMKLQPNGVRSEGAVK